MEIKQLIYEAKKGSSAAMKALHDGLYEKFLALCIRYVKNEADAEERLMDGFYKFFKSLPNFTYKSDDEVHGFIHRIMVNECIMQLQKTRVFHIVAEPSELDAIIDEDSLAKISKEEIHKLVTRLPIGARLVFNLYVVEGYPHEEIAGFLGISVNTSRSQLASARASLQKSILSLNENHEKQQSK